MDRRYPQRPMVGVGALIFRNDEVLLVQRGREPALGKWSLPGGLVEVGESLHDAVCREVLEEVGLRVRAIDLVAALDRVILDEGGRIKYHYILLDFLCESVDDEQPHPASDVKDCRFLSIEELSSCNLTRGTGKVIYRTFAGTRGQNSPVYNADL